jgi:hypothetical protein
MKMKAKVRGLAVSASVGPTRFQYCFHDRQKVVDDDVEVKLCASGRVGFVPSGRGRNGQR